MEPKLTPNKIRGSNVECLKVHFVFRFFYRACLLGSMFCARIWLANGISLPEVRLSQVIKHLLLLVCPV